jgi:hypothetical protein
MFKCHRRLAGKYTIGLALTMLALACSASAAQANFALGLGDPALTGQGTNAQAASAYSAMHTINGSVVRAWRGPPWLPRERASRRAFTPPIRPIPGTAGALWTPPFAWRASTISRY